MKDALQYLEEFNMVSVTFRLVLATVLGGLVGIERATKRRSAGLRTFALVCLGSAVAMSTNQYLILKTGSTGDSSRMAAQVISGIGFLGVGTIIVTGKNHVSGLTTAASLWTTATMGIAIGAGFIWGGVVSFMLIMITIRLLQYISHYQEEHNRFFDVYVEIDRTQGYNEVMKYFETQPYLIRSIQKKRERPIIDTDITLMIKLDLKKRYHHQTILADLRHVNGIHYLEEIR